MPGGHIIDESTKKTNQAKAAKITSKNGHQTQDRAQVTDFPNSSAVPPVEEHTATVSTENTT